MGALFKIMAFKEKKTGLLIILFLGFLNIFAWLVIYFSQNKAITVTFFDVGQGDAILISQGDKQILIDGGPNSAVIEKLSSEMPFWDRNIELVVLTHADSDHLSGLIDVLKSYQVERVVSNGLKENSADFKEWEDLLRKEKAEIRTVKLGDTVNINSQTVFEIIYPFEDLSLKQTENSNNNSLVIKFICKGKSFLFSGDVLKSGQKDIVEKGIDIDADVLKVSHHGSKSANYNKFIEKVSPQLAVISVGANNRYGHPDQETLDTLDKYGIKVLRTDLDKDIKISCSSQSLIPKEKE